MSPLEEASSIVHRIPGTTAWTLEVIDNRQISTSLRQLTLGGSLVGSVSYRSGQDIMVNVPIPGNTDRSVRRRYTIRRSDPIRDSIDLQILLDSNGPGASWARDATPGDTVEAIGPRGKIFLDPAAEWHLLIGDRCAVPNTAVMVESVDPSTPCMVAVAGFDPRIALDREMTAPVTATPTPTGSGGSEIGQSATDTALPPQVQFFDVPMSQDPELQCKLLLRALGEIPLPEGPGRVYANGELKLVAAARDQLLSIGVEPAQITTKAYWRRGLPNAERGEPEKS